MFARRLALVRLAALASLLAACASSEAPNVSTTFDPLVPFPRQATYSWDEAANQLPDDSRIDRSEIDGIIREAVDAEMSARGYRPVAPGAAANYRLSYDLAIHTWLAADNSRSVGSLSLWLSEAASRRRVWMGYVRAEIYVGLSRPDRVARLREAIGRMLEKFPPSQRPPD
jgi:hypothetical protein